MARANDPQRVIMRGKTRVIGAAPRPREGSGTPAQKAAPSTNARQIGTPRLPDNAQGRFTQGEKREAQQRSVPARDPAPRDAAPAQRTSSEEMRPLERIKQLEEQVSALMLRVFGNGQPVLEGEDPPLSDAVLDLEAVTATLSESMGELILRVGDSGKDDQPATGLVAAVADLTQKVMTHPDTIKPPADETPTEPLAVAGPEGP